jgi:hypothetical protein
MGLPGGVGSRVMEAPDPEVQAHHSTGRLYQCSNRIVKTKVNRQVSGGKASVGVGEDQGLILLPDGKSCGGKPTCRGKLLATMKRGARCDKMAP